MTDRTDNFNRTDTASAIGTPSDGGSAWVQAAGTWGISTNKAYNSTADTEADAWLEASAADVDVQATLSSIANADGLISRAADTSNYLLWWINSGVGTLELYKKVAGSFTLLGSTGFANTGSDILKLSVSGSSLNAYANATLKVGPITDSAGSTNTKHGLRADGDSSVRFDDFSITATGGATTRPVKMAGRFGGYAGSSGGFAG